MYCTSCGNEIKNGAKFCENCGAKVEDMIAESVEETVEEVVEETVAPVVEAAAPDYEAKEDIVKETVSKAFEEEKAEKVAGQVVNDNGRTYSSAGASTETKAASSNAENKGFAIASLVCGIVSLLCCCCCSPVGLICGGVAIGLGIYVIKKELPGKEMAIAGIVCGGISVLFSLVACILKLVGVAIPAASDISDFDIEHFIESLDI